MWVNQFVNKLIKEFTEEMTALDIVRYWFLKWAEWCNVTVSLDELHAFRYWIFACSGKMWFAVVCRAIWSNMCVPDMRMFSKMICVAASWMRAMDLAAYLRNLVVSWITWASPLLTFSKQWEYVCKCLKCLAKRVTVISAAALRWAVHFRPVEVLYHRDKSIIFRWQANVVYVPTVWKQWKMLHRFQSWSCIMKINSSWSIVVLTIIVLIQENIAWMCPVELWSCDARSHSELWGCDAASRLELWGRDFPSRVELWGCDAQKEGIVRGKHDFIGPSIRDFFNVGVLTFCSLLQSFPWKDLMVLQGVLGADAARQVRIVSNLCKMSRLENWSSLHDDKIQGNSAFVIEKCSPLNRLLSKAALHVVFAPRSCVLLCAQF